MVIKLRLWHKDLIDVLPQKQLVAQWRECCAIISNIENKGTPNHLLVNKILWYNKSHLYSYCCLVCSEMLKRGYNVSDKSVEKIRGYCSIDEQQVSSRIEKDNILFEGWHNKRYLIQCFYNLQEKFDCGGLTPDEWKLVHDKVCKLLNREDLKL